MMRRNSDDSVTKWTPTKKTTKKRATTKYLKLEKRSGERNVDNRMQLEEDV